MLLDIEVDHIDEENVIIKYVWDKHKAMPTRVHKAMEAVEDSKIYRILSKRYSVAYAAVYREQLPPSMTDDQIEQALDRIAEKHGFGTGVEIEMSEEHIQGAIDEYFVQK